jgi:CO/xanthine dehydrogenase FAD-binding subunit
MIIEYHRPQTLEEALALLGRSDPPTVPLGGGSALNKPSSERVAVVDLQGLALAGARRQGNTLELGATLTLAALAEASTRTADPGESGALPLQPDLRKALLLEASYNLRQVATVAGTLFAADGRSPWTTALLALDAELSLYRKGSSEPEQLGLGDMLPVRRALQGSLVTRVAIPINASLAYEYVARTPADWPVVCVAVARWPSGRTRVALGGFAEAPLLAMDGPQPEGAQAAAADAYSQAVDTWASAKYRREMAALLTERALGRQSESDI